MTSATATRVDFRMPVEHRGGWGGGGGGGVIGPRRRCGCEAYGANTGWLAGGGGVFPCGKSCAGTELTLRRQKAATTGRWRARLCAGQSSLIVNRGLIRVRLFVIIGVTTPPPPRYAYLAVRFQCHQHGVPGGGVVGWA